MIDEKTLKERYLRDAVPTRLGNLASNIKRLGYFIDKKNSTRVFKIFCRNAVFFLNGLPQTPNLRRARRWRLCSSS